MVQREVAERIAAPPGADELPVGLRPVPRRRPDRVRSCRRRRSSPSRPSTRRSSSSSRTPADDRPRRRRRRTRSGGSSRRRFRERRKMLHNVLARQLPPSTPARVDGGARRGRHRPGSAAPDARGRGVARAPRGARRRSARTARGDDRRDRVAPDPARPSTPVVRLAPAKLNLTLAVVGRRPDGYPRRSTR